jgi:seryl-tRNA synthetase
VITGEPGRVKAALLKRNDKSDVDAILALDAERKRIIGEVEALKAEKNRVSKAVGAAKKAGRDAAAEITAMRETGEKISALDDRLSAVAAELREKMLWLPNLSDPSTPEGKSAADNPVVREWGESAPKDFPLRDHVTLSEALDILDFKRGAKIAGSGFVLYKGAGALLERALINYFLDANVKAGFTEVFPPFMVNPACAESVGHLPKFRDQMYFVGEDDLFLLPTAELPVTNIFRDEILPHKDLPVYYTAYSACFRREAGSWGKDTRGFLRVHQFNKVEMLKFTTPETSDQELESLTACAEALLKGLGLRYRVVTLCTGDLGFASAKTYDLEVYAEAEKKWLEVSSCSNFTDFQARRANIRFRDESGRVRFVHTLNGSGLATSRVLVALLENYQRPDGSVTVPEALRPYMKGLSEIRKTP